MNEADITPTTPVPQPSSSPGASPITFDESQIAADYANVGRLSGTPEEIILDFGFQVQSGGDSTNAVANTLRIVTGWHTAKRMFQALLLTVQRHEQTFGPLELDARKRLRSQ